MERQYGDLETKITLERDPMTGDILVRVVAHEELDSYLLNFRYKCGTLTEQVLEKDILKKVNEIKAKRMKQENTRKEEQTMTHKELFKHITENMYATYCKKNADYGNSFGDSFNELGIISAITRMNDKMNRLKSLAINPVAQVKDESIEDTLLDLANYAVMTLIEIKSKQGDVVHDTLEEEQKETSSNKIDHFKEARKIDVKNLPRVLKEQLSEYAYEAVVSYNLVSDIKPDKENILLCDLSKNITQYIVYLDLNEDDMEGEDVIKMYAEVVRLRDIMAIEFENIYGHKPGIFF